MDIDDIALHRIPSARYYDYRNQVIFGAYKWDPQVGDANTVSQYAAVMTRALSDRLGDWAERLARETMAMERAMARDIVSASGLRRAKALGLPSPILRALRSAGEGDPSRHVRLMRFDFHPTRTGWAVSEVNSDVPGGLAEASVLPQIAGQYIAQAEPGADPGGMLLQAFQRKREPGAIAFVHCTSYADDRQVMQFLGDRFEAAGLDALYVAPDHLRWANGKAVSILDGRRGPVGGIVRFFPLEWLSSLPRGSGWRGYFTGDTPACNHPNAMFTQSKRLPLVWDALPVDVPTWRALLPETVSPRNVPRGEAGWILKPALGRVGEGITVPGAVPEKERSKIERAARMHPRAWVAQKLFDSAPLEGAEGERYHLCVGVFTVDGARAGFYGRISPRARIDSEAKDIPILILKEDKRDA